MKEFYKNGQIFFDVFRISSQKFGKIFRSYNCGIYNIIFLCYISIDFKCVIYHITIRSEYFFPIFEMIFWIRQKKSDHFYKILSLFDSDQIYNIIKNKIISNQMFIYLINHNGVVNFDFDDI